MRVRVTGVTEGGYSKVLAEGQATESDGFTRVSGDDNKTVVLDRTQNEVVIDLKELPPETRFLRLWTRD